MNQRAGPTVWVSAGEGESIMLAQLNLIDELAGQILHMSPASGESPSLAGAIAVASAAWGKLYYLIL